MEVRCVDPIQRDFGFEMRRLLLRRVKDYYQTFCKRTIPDNEENIALLNAISNNEELSMEYGYIPVFEENELSQVFYSYKTGESFIAIKNEDEYRYLDESYSLSTSFSSSLALNIGFCYKLFKYECDRIEDNDLVKSLEKEVSKMEELFKKEKTLLKKDS